MPKNLTQLEREFYFQRDPANVIVNASFETNTTGWNLEADYTRSNEQAQAGSFSIKQVSTAGFSNLLTEDAGIPLTPGLGYTISYYARVTINSGNPPKFRVTHTDKYGDSGVNNGVTILEDEVTASGSFTRRAYSFTAPMSTVWLRIFNNNGNVTAYYDSFKLSPNRRVIEFNDVKRAYLVSQTGLPQRSGWADLERAYLRNIITANGGTPNGKYTSALLMQALAILSLRVSKLEDDNWRTFYIGYTGA